ncbi:hypothetical protein CHELA20_53052 [Hyphomicrobiales bacterium]|nr:hypothetical protein CHELA20_53052 [Hyphomicrobiales bacterium]
MHWPDGRVLPGMSLFRLHAFGGHCDREKSRDGREAPERLARWGLIAVDMGKSKRLIDVLSRTRHPVAQNWQGYGRDSGALRVAPRYRLRGSTHPAADACIKAREGDRHDAC